MPYYDMMDFMMGGFPFMGFGSIFTTLLSLVVAYLVYKDAEKRGMNGLLWGLPILVPWIGILFLIFYLIMRDSERHIVAEGSSVPTRTTAEEVLDERYAKGEVAREVYLQMKEDLKKGPKETSI
ncbi:MAG: SHOCT domain-containing protein [Methanothrix sp.]|nr:SHOCT domain-containing protein [Methanothrix sp.]